MDKSSPEVLSAVLNLQSSDADIRSKAEVELYEHVQAPHFTIKLLNSVGDFSIDTNKRIAAARFFQDRVFHDWQRPGHFSLDNVRRNQLLKHRRKEDRSSPHLPRPIGQAEVRVTIPETEQALIKANLIPVFIKCLGISEIHPLLLDAFISIAYCEEAHDEPAASIYALIEDLSDLSLVKLGLSLLVELVEIQRVRLFHSAKMILTEVITKTFTLFEMIVPQLLSLNLSQLAECLSLVITIYSQFWAFKKIKELFFAPVLDDTLHSTNCFQWHKAILTHPNLLIAVKVDPLLRPLHLWVMAMEGSVHNLIYFPEVTDEVKLDIFWDLIERWYSKKIWLLDRTISDVFDFFKSLLDTPSWLLIIEKLKSIGGKVFLKALDSTHHTIELFQKIPEDYLVMMTSKHVARTRWIVPRFANLEVSVGELIQKLPEDVLKPIVDYFVDTIQDRSALRAEDKLLFARAQLVDGALRVHRIVATYVPSNLVSPAQYTETLLKYALPELSPDTLKAQPWLTARACNVILLLSNSHFEANEEMSQAIFESLMYCFNNLDLFVIQVFAYKALENLSCIKSINLRLKLEGRRIFKQLLLIHKMHPLNVVADALLAQGVQQSAAELVPLIVEHFRLVVSNDDEQSMQFQNFIYKCYEKTCGDIENMLKMKFVDVLELASRNGSLDSENLVPILYNFANSITTVLSEIWQIYLVIVEAFETAERRRNYLELVDFAHFFRSVVKIGFPSLPTDSPQVQSLFELCFHQIKRNWFFESPHAAFELLELATLSYGEKISSLLPHLLEKLHEISQVYVDECAGYESSLNGFLYVRVLLAACIADADTTLKFINDKDFLKPFYLIWRQNRSKFQHLYGLKLQTLASSLILRSNETENIPFNFRKRIFSKFCDDVSLLREAIKAPDYLLRKCNHPTNSRVSGDSDCKDCADFWNRMLDATLPPRVSQLYDLDILSAMYDCVDERSQWAFTYCTDADNSKSV